MIFSENRLECFELGIFVTDRQIPADHQGLHQVSLVWNQPNVLISLVDRAFSITRLSLLGYEDLTDLALEYIAGRVGTSRGLPNLTVIILPVKCFVTPMGIRALLESLPMLEVVRNQGKMGAMICPAPSSDQITPLVLQFGKPTLKLKEFCQMESLTSGGMDEETFEVNENPEPWIPTDVSIHYVMKLCPRISW